MYRCIDSMYFFNCDSNQGSPTTPKNVLRGYIYDLTKDLNELREFTTLEKQLMCEEHHCGTHVSVLNLYWQNIIIYSSI